MKALIRLERVVQGGSTSVRPQYAWLLVVGTALWLLAFAQAIADESVGTNVYRLGPGDHILVSVFAEPDLSMDVRLNDAGTLSYPFLGVLQVEGLSVAELEQLITKGLKGSYLVNPEVTVSIRAYRPFFLHGEVVRPGGIPYQPGLTLERAIALAGGFTERASKKKITVIRGGDTDLVTRPIKLSDPVSPDDVITVHRSFF